MASKLQFQITADGVDINALWNALTKDKIEVIRKAAPNLLAESQILEDDGHGNICLGSILHVSFGTDALNLAPFKEKIVEFDEASHLLSFLGLEGGFMKRGFTYYVVSFKLDHIEEGYTIISTTLAYDLEKDFDGTQVLDEFVKILNNYLNSVVRYMQENKV